MKSRIGTTFAALAALIAPLGLAAAAPTASAVTATKSVAFQNCEVRDNPYTTNQLVGSKFTWNTTIKLEHPAPLAANDPVTVRTTIGAVPANRIPSIAKNATIGEVSVVFTNDVAGDLQVRSNPVHLGAYNTASPLSIPEFAYTVNFGDAGFFSHRPKSVYILLNGHTAGDDFLEYSLTCDLVVNPQPILTAAVYDLRATAELTTTSLSARQGARIRLTGKHFLFQAPRTPAARATVTIGGISAGTLTVNQTGAVSGVVTVPPFVKPGTQVRVVARNGSKQATVTIAVKAAKGKAKVNRKKVRPGARLTVSGSAFKPGERLRITVKGGRAAKGAKRSFVTSVKVKKNGKFSKRVALRKAAKGNWKVTVKGAASGRTAKVKFKVA